MQIVLIDSQLNKKMRFLTYKLNLLLSVKNNRNIMFQ